MKLILIDDDEDEIAEYDLTDAYDMKTPKGVKELITEIKDDIRIFAKPLPKKKPKKKATPKTQEAPVIH